MAVICTPAAKRVPPFQTKRVEPKKPDLDKFKPQPSNLNEMMNPSGMNFFGLGSRKKDLNW
ncbi:MAG: hypothetical protein PHU63_01795 [Candidatus ainarchaeum sp.]|nr:hypothetical protein [Candidatus ainarchaeum sp.]